MKRFQYVLIAIVLILTLVGGYFRLYSLPETLLFLGDQGRDAIRVARIFKQGDLVFIGPVTSIGNMYLGPFYYYFMLPFLWLSYPSPVGPAYAVAILSLLSIPLLYLMGKDLVGRKAALFATVLFTFSTVLISYARFSWNPNPAPFVAIVLLWALHKVWNKQYLYWILVSASISILIQLHYVALLATVPAIFVLVAQLFDLKKITKPAIKSFFVSIVFATLLAILFITPLLVFDVKHGGINRNALSSLLGGSTSITRFESTRTLDKIVSVLVETHGRSMQIMFDMYIGQVRDRNTVLVGIVIVLILLYVVKKKRLSKAHALILMFIGTTILGTSVYSHNLYDHYILFVIPIVLLLYGVILAEFWKLGLLGKGLTILLITFYVWTNISNWEFQTASPSLGVLEESASSVATRLRDNEVYNIVLLSETKDYYGQNYRYYLDTIKNKEPLNPDHDDLSQVSTLVIINEEGIPEEEIALLPIFEIASFSDAQQKESFQLPSGIEAYIWRKSE